MGFSCGIVGLPNVGKSSLFNILTKAGATASNYPFCTIDPNIGIVSVPDERLDLLYETIRPERKVPATIRFVDIAGLVAGASQGEGLGNQFLSHIREVQVICHVVRLFHDSNIIRTGDMDPVKDLGVIETELALKDLESLQKRSDKLSKRVRSQSDPSANEEMEIIRQCIDGISNERTFTEITADMPDQKKDMIRSMQLFVSKPAFVVANMDDAMDTHTSEYARLTEYCRRRDYALIPISVKIEEEIEMLSDSNERELFRKDYGILQSGLETVIRTGYKLLELETFFTAGGPNEARAWTIRRGTMAKQAAGIIHSDFERGFIKAEVLSFRDFLEYRDFHRARENGRLRIEGKDYIVQDGDIIEFRFHVS